MNNLIKKPNETKEDRQVRKALCCKAFKDARLYGTMSPYFYYASSQENSDTPRITLLEAIEQKNPLQCILHFGQGTSLTQVSKRNKSTLLHVAANCGNYPVCSFLLTSGHFTDFDRTNAQGLSAWDYAAMNMHHSIPQHKNNLPFQLQCSAEESLEQCLESRMPKESILETYHLLKADTKDELKDAGKRLLTYALKYTHIQKLHERLPFLLTFAECNTYQTFDAQISDFIATLDLSDTASIYRFIRLAAIYHAYTSYQEAIHVLLIYQSEQNAQFSSIPKDVILFVLLPHVRPLWHKKHSRAAALQYDIFNRLLKRHPRGDSLNIEGAQEQFKITVYEHIKTTSKNAAS